MLSDMCAFSIRPFLAIWLLLLALLSTGSPLVTLAYDAQWHSIFGYDTPCATPSFGSDAACALVHHEGKIGTSRVWGLFGSFAEFLAAKAGEWNAPVGWRLPTSNGAWSGEPGNSLWKSEIPEVNQITGNRPIVFKKGYIDLSPYSVANYQFKNLTGLNTDFSRADAQLARDMQLNSPNVAKVWRSLNQLSWHHLEDGETLQLIPTVLNDIPHVGGASILRTQ